MIQPLLDQSAYENPRDWTHLLIARNGDVLKGRWVEMNATHLIFATRVREQRFDRANIAGCIQVQSSKKEKPPEATQAMGLLLADGIPNFSGNLKERLSPIGMAIRLFMARRVCRSNV